MSGIMGPKRRIHLHVDHVLKDELDSIKNQHDNSNKQIQALAQVIDDSILSNYTTCQSMPNWTFTLFQYIICCWFKDAGMEIEQYYGADCHNNGNRQD